MSAKDYFEDITPPGPQAPRPRVEPPAQSTVSSFEEHDAPVPERSEGAEKSIRNIQVPARPRRMTEMRENSSPPPPRKTSRMWLWGGVVVAFLILGAIGLIALRPTTITVIPRSHAVLFDETARFTAYPAGMAATGTLQFTLETNVFDDSQVVPAEGMEHVEERASGQVIVYNEYSASPVKLLKNTRFATPDGLIFRAPAEVVIPGRKGTTPGQIEVTIFADSAGEKYNVGPISRFTLPGLKSSPDMYAKVYARSSTQMHGGFSGERPAAAPGAVDAAKAEIRGRLEEKARETVRARSDGTFAFFGLARLTFESLPPTAEEGGVRLHERLQMELPVFQADSFANIVAESVSADAEPGSTVLKPGAPFSAHPIATTSSLVDAPLIFNLEGMARLVWRVDTNELATSLAGREEAAFQTIVANFTGIEEAHARIEPFWKREFPADPTALKIVVQEPKDAQ